MADDYTIRIHAGDLADIIRAAADARADLETCIRDATEAQAEFQKELDNAHKIYRSLRQSVCEALQLPVGVGHLSDDELVSWVKIAREDAGDIMAEPGPLNGPPVKQDVDPAWLDAAQQRVGEQLTADPDVKHAHDAQRQFRERGYVLGCAVHGAHPHDGHDCEVCTMCHPVDVDGTPTESMPAVEEPEPPAGYQIWRVFTRGDDCPAREELDLVINRSGDVMRVFTEGMPQGEGTVLRQDGSNVSWSEQLHMNGTLWEIVFQGDPADVEQAGPETAADNG